MKRGRKPGPPSARNLAIVERYRAGEKMREIAGSLGITIQRVQQIIRHLDLQVWRTRAEKIRIRRNRQRVPFTPDGLFSAMKVTESGCWEWIGARNQQGYGTVSMGKGHGAMIVSRLMYIIATTQPLPKKMHVCHHCDNPPCCNPEHLFVGTARDNMIDRRRKEKAQGYPLRGRLQRACQYIYKQHNNPDCACEFCGHYRRYRRDHHSPIRDALEKSA